jgi:hypothetical protein
MHSNEKMIKLCREYGQKNVIVYHTGTKYRKNPEVYKSLFEGCVVVCDTPDLIGLNGEDDVLISMTVNTGLLRSRKDMDKPYVFAHYPSKSQVKGSVKIENAMREAHSESADFVFNITTIYNVYQSVTFTSNCYPQNKTGSITAHGVRLH